MEKYIRKALNMLYPFSCEEVNHNKLYITTMSALTIRLKLMLALLQECLDVRDDTVEPLTNEHPHQRPSLSYDHISCDGQWFLFVYESLTSDHPSYIRPHQCDSEGGRIRGVLLYNDL